MKRFAPRLLTLFTVGQLVFILPVGVLANSDSQTIESLNSIFITASAKAKPAVVTITAERVMRQRFRHPFFEFRNPDFMPERESRGEVLGSGVIIDAQNGHIVTNNHVIEDAEAIHVMLYDHRELAAEIVGTDPASDLAIIEVDPKELSGITLGNSDDLEVGEWVLAIGSPFSEGLGHSITAGIVSATGRGGVLRPGNYEDFIQTDAAINPGNSGGPLVNLKGELVGINTAIATDGFSRANAGIGFAIPINMVKRVMGDLIEHGKVTRAYLGVQIGDVRASIAKAFGLDKVEGALVNEVVEDTPAEEAGLKDGDIILKVDDVDIRNSSHLRNLISSSRPGDRRKLTLFRDGKTKTVTVKLGELEPETFASRDGRSSGDDGYDQLGLDVTDIDSRTAERYDLEVDSGVVISRVDPGSQAAREGLRPGDVIIRVGRQRIDNRRDFDAALQGYGSGDTVLLRVVRGEVMRFVGLEIG